ncbi:MAG: lytic transglycosylase domain-containing protein, partial [Oligoflexales bacterium]|nr:lytic transglycosylase domain-containing protein [Oligoflexales bacterium]
KLSYQYITLADSLEKNLDKYTKAQISVYRAQAYVNEKIYEPAIRLLDNSINSIEDKKLEITALELLLSSLFEINDFKKYAIAYKEYSARVPLHLQANVIIKETSLVYENSDREKYYGLLEHMALKYPITEESVWALDRLISDMEKGGKYGKNGYRFSVDYLKRLSRNVAPNNHLREKINWILNYPVKYCSQVRLLTEIEKIRVLILIRQYKDALALANVQKDIVSSEESRTIIFKYLGEIHNHLENEIESEKNYRSYFQNAKTGKRDIWALVNLAVVLAKQKKFKQSANIYEELAKITDDERYKWQHFWNLYLARDYGNALDVLKKADYINSLDPVEPMGKEYWQAKILLNKGEKDKAYSIFKDIVRKSPYNYYSTIILGGYPEIRKKISNWAENSNTMLAANTTDKSSDLDLRATTGSEDNLLAINENKLNRSNYKDSTPMDVESRLAKRRASFPLAFDEVIEPVSGILEIDKFFILSVIRAESNFNPNANSPVGAAGLMQMMPYTFAKISTLMGDSKVQLEKMSDPATNLVYGSFYLKHLIRYYNGNQIVALAAYNAGPSAVNEWLKICNGCNLDEFVETISYPETRRYVKKIMRYYDKYREMYLDESYLREIPSTIPEKVNSQLVAF